MADRKLRVGVIGLNMGAGHAVNYKTLPNAELAAICDISKSWLDHCQKEWNVPLAFTDYKELLGRDDIDAVSIAVPTLQHASMTIKALKAGKHVLVEKPMAVNAEEAREMAAVAKAAGLTLMVSYNQRFGPDIIFLKRYIEEGHLGDIYFVRTIWRRPMGMLPVPMMTRPNGEVYNRNWFNEADKGGGVAKDLGAHVIDIAMWLIGYPEVQDVVGKTYNVFLPEFLEGKGVASDADDHSVGFVRFNNGISLQFEASFGSYSESEYIATEIFGSKGGVLRVQGQTPKLFSKVSNSFTTILPRLDEEATCTQKEFVNAVLEGREPIVTADQGIAVTRIIDGIYG